MADGVVEYGIPGDVALLLQRTGVPFRFLTYAYHAGGGTRDAAAQLGVEERRVIKTLIFTGTGEPAAGVVALMPGTCRVSTRKLEKLSGARWLKPASPGDAEQLTGRSTGGISQFGLPGRLRLYIEEDIRDMDIVYFNAGARGAVVEASPKILEGLPAVWGDLRAPGAGS